jgi:predicted type IV restriction endonuclease
LSSKPSNCSENIVKRTLEALGRKIKEPSEFIPGLKKKKIEPFFELVSK